MNPTRLARALVTLFPRTFRAEYAGDLIHLFGEQWRETGAGLGRRVRLVVDLLTSAAREWRTELVHRNRPPHRRLTCSFSISSINSAGWLELRPSPAPRSSRSR